MISTLLQVIQRVVLPCKRSESGVDLMDVAPCLTRRRHFRICHTCAWQEPGQAPPASPTVELYCTSSNHP